LCGTDDEHIDVAASVAVAVRSRAEDGEVIGSDFPAGDLGAQPSLQLRSDVRELLERWGRNVVAVERVLVSVPGFLCPRETLLSESSESRVDRWLRPIRFEQPASTTRFRAATVAKVIDKLQMLRNIGQFDSVVAGAEVPLARLSVVYAENGRGKTTLAAILRSLSSGDPLPIAERRRCSAPATHRSGVFRWASDGGLREQRLEHDSSGHDDFR